MLGEEWRLASRYTGTPRGCGEGAEWALPPSLSHRLDATRVERWSGVCSLLYPPSGGDKTKEADGRSATGVAGLEGLGTRVTLSVRAKVTCRVREGRVNRLQGLTGVRDDDFFRVQGP